MDSLRRRAVLAVSVDTVMSCDIVCRKEWYLDLFCVFFLVSDIISKKAHSTSQDTTPKRGTSLPNKNKINPQKQKPIHCKLSIKPFPRHSHKATNCMKTHLASTSSRSKAEYNTAMDINEAHNSGLIPDKQRSHNSRLIPSNNTHRETIHYEADHDKGLPKRLFL